MSIKDRGERYIQVIDFLRKQFISKYKKEPTGLEDTMLKRKAAEQVEEEFKVTKFPETKITDWTKERPTTGPKADVKKFPKEKKLTPEPIQTSIDRLTKELDEMEKLGKNYKETTVGDFIADYFDMPQKPKTRPGKINYEEMQSKFPNVKLYGDESFDELLEIEKTGMHPRDNKAAGGRIGFNGGGTRIKKVKDFINEQMSKKKNKGEVVVADDAPVSEKTKLQREFDAFNQRFKEKTADTEVTLPNGIKGIIDTTYEPKIKKFEGMSKIILSPDEATKLAKKEKLEGIESLLSGESIALSRGSGKGLIVNHNGKIFIREKIKDRPNPIKEDEKPIIEELEEMWNDEGPVQMSMEDLIEFRTQKPAGKGMFTKAEAIRARLENTIKGAKPGDEDYDWVMETFPRWIDEIEKNPSLADNETVWKELAMTGLPKNQRFKIYDDGTVDFQTLKPTHQFKLREDIKRKLNASGGLNYLMGM
jgi:hypothetical protein